MEGLWIFIQNIMVTLYKYEFYLIINFKKAKEILPFIVLKAVKKISEQDDFVRVDSLNQRF